MNFVRLSFTALVSILLCTAPVFAQSKIRLGAVRIFNNDRIGDGQDRWRTGAYAGSIVRGEAWTGRRPETIGALMEYRLRTEIIAPADLTNPVVAPDRLYAGAISLGAISHFRSGKTDISLGVDMVITGPQTRLGAFQSWAHNVLGITDPKVLGSQIGNGFHPTASLEIARAFSLPGSGAGTRFRPFFEAQLGIENFVRVGGDVTIGKLGANDLLVRDVVTGQRVAAVRGGNSRGASFVMGGDVARVFSSGYLPTSLGYAPVRTRVRLRSGVYYEMENSSVFYGLTWLGREFSAQPEGQLLGSLSVRLRF